MTVPRRPVRMMGSYHPCVRQPMHSPHIAHLLTLIRIGRLGTSLLDISSVTPPLSVLRILLMRRVRRADSQVSIAVSGKTYYPNVLYASLMLAPVLAERQVHIGEWIIYAPCWCLDLFASSLRSTGRERVEHVGFWAEPTGHIFLSESVS